MSYHSRLCDVPVRIETGIGATLASSWDTRKDHLVLTVGNPMRWLGPRMWPRRGGRLGEIISACKIDAQSLGASLGISWCYRQDRDAGVCVPTDREDHSISTGGYHSRKAGAVPSPAWQVWQAMASSALFSDGYVDKGEVKCHGLRSFILL